MNNELLNGQVRDLRLTKDEKCHVLGLADEEVEGFDKSFTNTIIF